MTSSFETYLVSLAYLGIIVSLAGQKWEAQQKIICKTPLSFLSFVRLAKIGISNCSQSFELLKGCMHKIPNILYQSFFITLIDTSIDMFLKF